MSCGDSCVNANRSCEATAARWDGRRAVFVVHTGQRTESTLHKQNESRNTVIKECIFREKSSIYSCSFDFLDLHKNCSNTHTHTHTHRHPSVQPTDCVCCLRPWSVVDPLRGLLAAVLSCIMASIPSQQRCVRVCVCDCMCVAAGM